MPDASDMELVLDYARHGSETAFAELVRRHINLVYSVAMRHVGIPGHAEEITQAVMIVLARKAASLRASTVLEGWLYETTRLTALSFLRGERRRQFREQEAYVQSTLQEPADDVLWKQLAPLLDQAMARLGKEDRDAVVLRFFKEKTVREVATAMRINEAAAQRRILRALEKLRKFLAKRGVISTTTVIAGTICAHSVQAAPPALAESVTAIAITKGAAAGTSTLTLTKGALKIMAWTKAKTAILTGIGLLLVAGTTTVAVREIHERTSEDSWRYVNIDSDKIAQLPPQVKILPTRLFSSDSLKQGGGPDSDKIVGINQPVANIVWAAYDWPQSRMIFPGGQPRGRYDFITTISQGPREALQKELKNKLGLAGRHEIRDMDVMLLEMRNAKAPGIKPPTQERYCYTHIDHNQVEIKWANEPLSRIIGFLENGSPMPIIDQTGATNRCSIDITWVEDPKDQMHQALQKVLLDQLGLELVPTRQPVDMLVLVKALN